MNLDSEDALFETLSLNRNIIDGSGPAYGGYGGGHLWWNWGYGMPTKLEVWTNDKGEKHRLYGPAVTCLRKYKLEEWWKEGKLHRIGGPARIHKDNMFWYKEGELHNLDGPAVIEKAGPKQYWIDGVRFTRKQFEWEIARRKRKGLIK